MHPIRIGLNNLKFILGAGEKEHLCIQRRVLQHRRLVPPYRNQIRWVRLVPQNFHETVGLSPKAFANLTRFRRALDAARKSEHASWADIAAAVGYYDQAHLIAEFRTIAGVTPRELLGELRTARTLV